MRGHRGRTAKSSKDPPVLAAQREAVSQPQNASNGDFLSKAEQVFGAERLPKDRAALLTDSVAIETGSQLRLSVSTGCDTALVFLSSMVVARLPARSGPGRFVVVLNLAQRPELSQSPSSSHAFVLVTSVYPSCCLPQLRFSFYVYIFIIREFLPCQDSSLYHSSKTIATVGMVKMLRYLY